MNGPEKDNLEFELSQYLDGQLSRRRSRRLERRLDQDPALREELKKYASLDEQITASAVRPLPGADYDWQRGEVMRMLERRRLLGEAARRPVFLRPVFWVTGPVALAVAAAIVVAVLPWFSTGPNNPVFVGQQSSASEVSVALVSPRAPAGGVSQVALRRLDENDYRLTLPAGDNGAIEVAASEPPPGTVMVSFTPHRQSAWAAGAPMPGDF